VFICTKLYKTQTNEFVQALGHDRSNPAGEPADPADDVDVFGRALVKRSGVGGRPA
jgi:hypothetical protein